MTAMLRHLSLVAVALLALAFVPVRAQQYSFQGYDRKSGLESQTINCMLQDHRGFIWACSEMGLYRFDGTNFERLGSDAGFDRDAYITSIDEDARNGRLWVATQSGLYAGDGLHFQKVEPDGKPLVADLTKQIVTLDDGRLLLIRGSRLMVLSPGRADGQWQLSSVFSAAQLARYPQLRTVTVVFPYHGVLWLGCGTALCEVDTHGGIRVHGVDEGVPTDEWSGIRVDSEGALWLRGAHAVRVRTAGGTRFIARDIPGRELDTVTNNGTFVEDPHGHIMTPTNSGLARWTGSTWNVIDRQNGLPDIGIKAVMFDRDGAMWLGTYGRGIFRLSNYDLVDGWSRVQGLDSVPNWAILRDAQGAMWFGNELGGSVLPRGDKRLSPWPVDILPVPRQILSLARAPDGAIWIGLYEHRLLRYDPASRLTQLVGELPTFIKALLFDRRGRLWIATEAGVYYIDRPGEPLQRAAVENDADDRCSDMTEDAHGAVWFACNAGVLRYADDRWTLMANTPAGAPSSFASLAVDRDGSLWLATSEPGLFRARVIGDRLDLTAVADGWLRRSLAYFVRRDRRGWIWVGGGAGVDVFDGKRWTHLSPDDGLIWDETDQNAFFEDDDGSIWIGTPVGVSHILRPEKMISASPHTVVITSVTRGSMSVADGGTVPDDGSHSSLSVRYSLLGRVSSSMPHFRYRLQGSDWIETGSHVVNFTNLPPGGYRFEVQSIDVDRRTLSPVAAFNFRIPAPWWRAWWTYPLGILLASLALVLVWRWRSRLLRRQNRRLETMVAERTAELTAEKQELERARAELYVQATHDGLTGLYNRMAILDLLATYLESGQRASSGLAVALIDVDHFKSINDTFGHQAGDATLQAIAQQLQSHVRGSDRLGRYGGEEILMVLPGIGDLDARNRVQQIQQAVSGIDHHWQGRSFRVTLSVGLVWVARREAATVEDVIRHADTALYTAKGEGRNKVVSAQLGV